MPIKIGIPNIIGLKLGAASVLKGFVGAVQVYPPQSVIASGFHYSTYTNKVTTAVPYISFKSDGSVVKSNTTGTGERTLVPWNNPVVVGAGNSVWIKVVQTGSTGGTYTGAQLGVRLPLSDIKTFRFTTTREGSVYKDFTVEFWDASSGGNLLSTGTMELGGEGYE